MFQLFHGHFTPAKPIRPKPDPPAHSTSFRRAMDGGTLRSSKARGALRASHEPLESGRVGWGGVGALGAWRQRVFVERIQSAFLRSIIQA